MEYIVYKNFNAKAICGGVNLPTGTVCTERGGMLYYDGKLLCRDQSANAHNFFARNDDGNGLKRGELIRTIKDTLSENDGLWERVFEDAVCNQYRRSEHQDHWLWNHAFYNADIADLEHIAALLTEQ